MGQDAMQATLESMGVHPESAEYVAGLVSAGKQGKARDYLCSFSEELFM